MNAYYCPAREYLRFSLRNHGLTNASGTSEQRCWALLHTHLCLWLSGTKGPPAPAAARRPQLHTRPMPSREAPRWLRAACQECPCSYPDSFPQQPAKTLSAVLGRMGPAIAYFRCSSKLCKNKGPHPHLVRHLLAGKHV